MTTPAIVLRRVGGFYEAHPADRAALKRALRYAASGFPVHEAPAYVAKLLDRGLEVRLCEEPGPGPLPSGRELDERAREMAEAQIAAHRARQPQPDVVQPDA